MSLSEDAYFSDDEVQYLCEAPMEGLRAMEMARLDEINNLIKERQILDRRIRKLQSLADLAHTIRHTARLREVLRSTPVQASLSFRKSA